MLLLSYPSLKGGIVATINGEQLLRPQSKHWLVLFSAYFAKLHCVPTGERRQLENSGHNPKGFNGAATQRITLSSCNQVSSRIE